jgi:hypothetical protein
MEEKPKTGSLYREDFDEIVRRLLAACERARANFERCQELREMTRAIRQQSRETRRRWHEFRSPQL